MVRTLERMEPNPCEMSMTPSLALAIMTPLSSPKHRPTTGTSSSASQTGQPQTVNATPPMSAEHIMAVPMDRSIPPVMMTNVTPKAIKPI